MAITPAYLVSNSAGVSQQTIDLITGLANEAVRLWGDALAGNAAINVALRFEETATNRASGGWTSGRNLGAENGFNLIAGVPAFELMSGTNLASSGADLTLIFDPDYLRDELFLDPTPQTRNDIPTTRTDGLSVLLHEIGHALGFIGYYNEAANNFDYSTKTLYDYRLTTIAGEAYFDGPNVRAILGAPAVLTDNNYAHYGNSNAYPPTTSDPLTGLMNGVVFYRGYAYTIGAIDLAFLADTGLGTIRDDILNLPMLEAMRGGAGNDTITGGPGANRLFGDAGDDVIDGGAGADLLYGGAGQDRFLTDRQDDLVFEDAGGGTDEIFSSANFYLYANVENLTLAGSADLFGVGNDLGNLITGNAGQNLLIGGGGNDEIRGGGARDAIFGEDGADTLLGEAGVDYIVGGGGNDTVDGGADADELYGLDGDDLLLAGAGFVTDILNGGAGNDVLRADSGLADYDLIDGGAGDDIYWVDTGADLTFEAAGGGTDTVHADIKVAGAGLYLYANVENLVLEGTTSFGVGNELANSLTGNGEANWLLGGAGDDVIDGKGGNDVLFGQAGSDTFVFGAGNGGDVIGDFTVGIDKLRLTASYSDFAQVQAHLTESNGDLAIDLGAGSGNLVVLLGVTIAQLTAADFMFG